jgi:TRAP-type C4-dicarboxylate transport system permease small subunit
MFLLMAMTCVDVAGRYFFNRPLPGGLELTEITMVLLVFAGLPIVTTAREHVTVDIVPLIRNRWLQRVHLLMADLIGVICLSALAWQLGLRAIRMAAVGDVTSQLRIPLGIMVWILAGLSALAAIALLLRALFPSWSISSGRPASDH